MHILITGGAGFIGSHIVEYHLNQHDSVHVLDDLSSGSENNISQFKSNPNFQFTKADILTFSQLDKVVCWADCIYHMAAIVGVLKVIKEPLKVLAVNMGGTERVLRAAQKSFWKPRIFIASTSEVYGTCDLNSSSEKSNLILGTGKKSCASYVISKLSAELLGETYFQQYGLPVTVLRLFNTIGPRQTGAYGMVVPRFIENAVKNNPIVVYGTGNQTRSFCDVRDMVSKLCGMLDNNRTIGELINIGHDQEISINDLAKLIKNIAKSHSDIQHIPYEEAYGRGFEDFMSRRPDLTKLHQLTCDGYQWDLKSTLTDLISTINLT